MEAKLTWDLNYNKDALQSLHKKINDLNKSNDLTEQSINEAFKDKQLSQFEPYLGKKEFTNYILDLFLSGNCKPTSTFLKLIKKVNIEKADKKSKPVIEGFWGGFILDSLLKESNIEGMELPKNPTLEAFLQLVKEKCRPLKESPVYQSLLLEDKAEKNNVQNKIYQSLLLKPLGELDTIGELTMKFHGLLKSLSSQNTTDNINTSTQKDLNIRTLREIREKLFPPES